MIISVASGKGGTGKTTVATNLALSIENNIQFLDCDVEEPNAHIFLTPRIKEKYPVSIPIPQIDLSKCNFCGRCAQICAYNALAVLKDKVLVFPELCHGCGACSYLCPQGAIKETNKVIGYVEAGQRGNIEFIHGLLNIGEAMAPPLIRAVKKKAQEQRSMPLTTVIDVPPGTSCPVIESVKNSDFCILVTEPTPFGLNDLMLAVQTLKELKIPFGVVINRSDLGDKGVDDYCRKEQIPVLLRIPFKKEIASAYSKGIPLVEALPQYKSEFKHLFATIKCNISQT
ncbi:MAG: ATP-binding protein [Candidatus Omnitrophica bacterium]|nr:ATP-binding protein [Candidatus Omnitrophota bacterium]